MAAADGRGSRWRRAIALAAMAIPSAAVIVIALLLFNQDLLDRVLGESTRSEAPAPQTVASRQPWAPEWVPIPQGRYTIGRPGSDREYEYTVISDLYMTRFEITNGLWARFVTAERHALERDVLWDLSIPREGWVFPEDGPPRPAPDEFDRPVRDVCALSVVRFGFWLTRALDLEREGFVARLPDAIEWEIAARGTTEGPYPWGEEFYGTPQGLGGEARPLVPLGLSRPQAVWGVELDVSPIGVVAMGTNVAEIVLRFPLQQGEKLMDAVQDRDNLVARGATFSTSILRAEELAKVWSSPRDLDPRHRMADVGVRMVKVRKESEER